MKRLYVFIMKVTIYKWLNVKSPCLGSLKNKSYKWFWTNASTLHVNAWNWNAGD